MFLSPLLVYQDLILLYCFFFNGIFIIYYGHECDFIFIIAKVTIHKKYKSCLNIRLRLSIIKHAPFHLSGGKGRGMGNRGSHSLGQYFARREALGGRNTRVNKYYI